MKFTRRCNLHSKDGLMIERKEKICASKATWLCPFGAMVYGNAMLVLLAAINVFFLREWGRLWLAMVRIVFSFGLYGYCVGSIRFFKLTSEDVTVYSFWGVFRKRVRFDEIRSVCGRWEKKLPVVCVRCHDGQAIRLEKERLKTCEQLIAQLQKKFSERGAHESEPEVVPLPKRRVTSCSPRFPDGWAEWAPEYLAGLVVLALHGLFLYLYLAEKGWT